jgi:GntR family transcriptional regulator, transcriptional repressor for pyruvate dehydrogenase complex
MNENVEVRFSRLERAPAYKTVSDAILKDSSEGDCGSAAGEEKLAEQFGVNRSTVREGTRLSEQTGCCGASSASGSWSAAHPMTALAIGSVRQ